MLEAFLNTIEDGVKMYSVSLESQKITEGMIAIKMEDLQKKYKGSVFIGSYPTLISEGKFSLQITFRGPNLTLCQQAKAELEEIFTNTLKG